jgi:PBP1b-binding outer membrane lipoprotein LpoB
METTNALGKNLKYFAVTLFLSGCAMHNEPAPKFVYVDKQKKISVGINAPWSVMATRKDVEKVGYTPATVPQVETFNRMDAKCDMECSNRITTSGLVTYDSRIACHSACLRSQGWSLIQLEGEVQ